MLAHFADLVGLHSFRFSSVDTRVALVTLASILRSLRHFAFWFDVSCFKLQLQSTYLIHVVLRSVLKPVFISLF